MRKKRDRRKNAVTVWLGPEANQGAPLSGSVYNLVQAKAKRSANGSGLNPSLYMG